MAGDTFMIRVTEPTVQPITTDRVAIRTASVEVRTLTLTRKQMTQSVFRQLPERDPICWETGQLLGEVWGWVNYLEGQFVWVSDGTLWRSPRHQARIRRAEEKLKEDLYQLLHRYKGALEHMVRHHLPLHPSCGDACPTRQKNLRHIHFSDGAAYHLIEPWWHPVQDFEWVLEKWYNTPGQTISADPYERRAYVPSRHIEESNAIVVEYQGDRATMEERGLALHTVLLTVLSQLSKVPQLFIAV